MLIERTDKEIVIRIPAFVNVDELQDFINYVRYKELSFDVNVPQEDIDKLASDFNKEWWENNREQFIR